MTKKILCATDGSNHTQHAVEFAGALAAKLNLPLTICVVNVARGGPRGPVIYSLEDADARKVVDDAAAIARKAGASNIDEKILMAREAAAAIVQFAEENGYDHIITGTGDKHGVSRLVLGSVAADVASRAHCTVTVAR